MSPPSLFRMIAQDLKPTPGRLRLTLRITVSTLITLAIVMAFRLPAALIALYFVIVLSRETPQQSLRWTAAIAIAICCSLGFVCFVVATTGNDPVVRLVSVAVVTFVAGVLVYSAKNPAVGSIGGYLYCIFIAYWEENTSPAVILNRSALTVIALIAALSIATLVELLFHYRNPLKLLLDADKDRWLALGALYESLGKECAQTERQARLRQCARFSADGQLEMRRLLRAVEGKRSGADRRSPFSMGYIAMLSELLDSSTALANRQLELLQGLDEPRYLEISTDCMLMAQGVFALAPSSDIPHELAGILSLLQHMSRERQQGGDSMGKPLNLDMHDYAPFFRPDAWRDKATLAFACKVSLCATVCYMIYHAVAWPAISSCVTTVLITALSTTGPMKQRLFFRFTGVLLGGVIVGLGTIIFLFPNMDSIASLIALVGGVAFAAAWISAGRTLGYLGLQLGFCFYAVVFRGPAPETQVQSARDACVGIFLAIGIMWLVFDQLWPVRVTTVMRMRLLGMTALVKNFLASASSGLDEIGVLDSARIMRHRVGENLAQIHMLNDMAIFELSIERTQLVGQAEALWQISVEVAAVAWDSLDFVYAQGSNSLAPVDWLRFRDGGLQTVEVIEQKLGEGDWKPGFAEGRYHAAQRERSNAESLEQTLLHLREKNV